MLPASPYVRYGAAVLCALVFLHVVGQLASPAYSQHTSLEAAKAKLGLKPRPAGETWIDGRRVAPGDTLRDRPPELAESRPAEEVIARVSIPTWPSPPPTRQV